MAEVMSVNRCGLGFWSQNLKKKDFSEVNWNRNCLDELKPVTT